MSRHFCFLVGLTVLLLTAACGGNGDPEPPASLTATPEPTPTPGYTSPQEPKEPSELKVAFINLMSPVTVDTRDPSAAETFDMRLEMIIDDLRAIDPDIVGFNEVSWTKDLGSAAERLAKALRMELQYVRANPWFPGQTQEMSDETVKLTGFDEGELILTKYPILRAKSTRLNPRTSETEGRSALQVVIKGPNGTGEIDIYITHLTGAPGRVLLGQAEDFARFISDTRADGAALVLADLGAPPDSDVVTVFKTLGFEDFAGGGGEAGPIVTCCRDGIIGEKAAVAGRTDYILGIGWEVTAVSTFGFTPRKRADDVVVYSSDHDGILVRLLPRAVVPMP
ncbi:MAG TPA: hypothetical protein VIH05_02740 [Tepidiformaceae bacterium]